jgi:hypothetical protein
MQLKTRNGLRPCGHCGQVFAADAEHFYQKKNGIWSSECRGCFRQRSSQNQKARHHSGGVSYHLAYIARSAKLRARKNRLEYEIDAHFLTSLLQKQDGCCALSRVLLTFAKGIGHVATNASIDRIDPNKGYTRDNVQLVAHQVNTMKSNRTLGELVEWCKLVLEGVNSSTDQPPFRSHEIQDRQYKVDQLDPGKGCEDAT